MKFLFSLITLACITFTFSQSDPIGIRDKFDEIYEELYVTGDFRPWSPEGLYSNNQDISKSNQARLGSSRAGMLDALIIMYEATCDIYYLEEFTKRAANIMSNRADRISPLVSSAPYWFRDHVHLHPRILMSFSKYVYLVNSQWTTLYDLPIDPALHEGNSTFGEFAVWLNTGNIEMMDYMLARFWRDNNECMGKPSPSSGSIAAGTYSPQIFKTNAKSTSWSSKPIYELNKQTPWGYALIYMYMVNPSRTDYGLKALEMARAFFITNGGILDYNSTHKAYTWYHDGWQQYKSGGVWKFHKNHQEDIGHAGFEVMFMMTFNKFYKNFSSLTGDYKYFEWYQMTRFRNGFTRLIYDYNASDIPATYINETTFSASVFGHGFDDYYHGDDGSLTQHDFQESAMHWMPLRKFDDTPLSLGSNNVYDIILDFYINKASSYSATQFEGINIKGLADIVAAYYDVEGINEGGCYVTSPKIVETVENITNKKGTNEKSKSFANVNDIVIYPNPVVQTLTISGPLTTENSFIIHDQQGRMILSGKNFGNIDVSDLAPGNYILTVNSLEQPIAKKRFIKN